MRVFTSRILFALAALLLACSLCALATGWMLSGSSVVRLTPTEIFRPAP